MDCTALQCTTDCPEELKETQPLWAINSLVSCVWAPTMHAPITGTGEALVMSMAELDTAPKYEEIASYLN